MSDVVGQAQYALDKWNLSTGHRVLIESLVAETGRLQERVVVCHEIMSDLYSIVNPNDDPELMDKMSLELTECDCPPPSEYEEMKQRIEALHIDIQGRSTTTALLQQRIEGLESSLVDSLEGRVELLGKVALQRALINEVEERSDKVANWLRKIRDEADEMFGVMWRRDDPPRESPQADGSLRVFTDDEINAAWEKMTRLRNSSNTAEHFMGKGMEVALKEFGIGRCERCKDHPANWSSTSGVKCPECDGFTWVRT